MTTPRVKIYGARNSGTRFLRNLIELNLDVRLHRGDVPARIRRLKPESEALRDLYFRLTSHRNLGWKHQVAHPPGTLRRMPAFTDSLIFITITKNPYAWLQSLYHRPYHYRGNAATFDEFLENPWHTVGRENAGRLFANPTVMWNMKNESYLALSQGVPTVNLRYIDLLADPEFIISRISAEFSVRWKLPRFSNYEHSTKGETGKDFTECQQYYLNEEWKESLSTSQLRIINRYLDPTLLTEFDYLPLEAV